MRYALILVLLLTSCATTQAYVKSDPLASPTDVAKLQIKPNLDLPPALDLSKYKIDVTNIRQYKENDKTYIALPEADLLNQQEFLLILKTRILELQRIITDAKKLI